MVDLQVIIADCDIKDKQCLLNMSCRTTNGKPSTVVGKARCTDLTFFVLEILYSQFNAFPAAF